MFLHAYDACNYWQLTQKLNTLATRLYAMRDRPGKDARIGSLIKHYFLPLVANFFVIERLSDVLKTLTSVTLTRELWPVACSTFKMPKKKVDQSFSTSISPSADNENITARIRTRRNDTGKKDKISTIYLSMTLNIIGNNLTTIYLTV